MLRACHRPYARGIPIHILAVLVKEFVHVMKRTTTANPSDAHKQYVEEFQQEMCESYQLF